MRFRILGPLGLLDADARPVTLGGQRERVLLATLLLEANHVVSRDRLVEAIWGERPPAGANNALQVHVSKLRRTLAATSESGAVIRTQQPGYLLETPPGELDAERFEALATSSPEDETPSDRSDRLSEALGLWSGPVLDGLDNDAWRGAITRLEERKLTALEQRIDADLALGRHGELVGELEALIEAHPLREGLRGQLMLALYRSGRQADALAVYRTTREVLAEEFGIDPNRTLQALELAILNQSPDLDVTLGDNKPSIAAAIPPGSAEVADRIPLPTRLETGPPVGVIGRETELQLLADAYKRVIGGGGRELLLVSGEAGLGKTTLVAEAARLAYDQGACVLFGHCEEDIASPYQYFSEALGHLVTHLHEDQIAMHIGAHGSELARLVPAFLRRVPDLSGSSATDADTERYLLFAAVVGILTTVSDDQPVVLVLDDLQWADRGSLSLLRHLAATAQAQRVLILATYRDSELAHADALRETLGALRRQSGVDRVELSGLDDTSVVSYLAAAAGQTLDDVGVELAHAVYRETDGNPFFVSEVLRHLSETGSIYRNADGRWVAEESLDHLALPDSVREVIGGRVVRLGKEFEHILSVAAVIGRDFDLDLLARATDISDDALLDALEASAGAALVEELGDTVGRFRFTHALIQHILYEDLGPTRRARAHRKVAEALEELSGQSNVSRVGELARHWVAAIQPIDLSKAIRYSQLAGDEALVALAPADSLQYYNQALELVAQSADSDPVLELDLLIGLGTAKRQTGDPTFRDTLLLASRQAAALGDNERLVAAALANDRGTFSTVSTLDAEKVEILEMALDRLPPDHVDRALILATLCSELTIGSTLERRESLADEALSIAEWSGDDLVVVRVLNHVHLPLAVPHLLELSRTRAIDALTRAERIGDPVLQCSAASGRRFIAACEGDIEEMDRCLEIKRPLVERLDQPFLHWVHTLQRATRALIAGDAGRAEELATEALQIGTDGGQPDAFIIYGAQIIMVNLWRGTLDALVPLIEGAIADNPGLPVFVAALALAHAESGRTEETRALLQDFSKLHFDLPLDATWLTGMIAYADAAIECRDPQFAEPLLARLEPFADQWLYTDVATSGPISRSVGDLLTVLGRYDEAEVHLAHSAASSQGADAVYFAARTGVSWGRMLVERGGPGDREDARELLDRAHQTARAEGYGTVERRAFETLQLLDA